MIIFIIATFFASIFLGVNRAFENRSKVNVFISIFVPYYGLIYFVLAKHQDRWNMVKEITINLTKLALKGFGRVISYLFNLIKNTQGYLDVVSLYEEFITPKNHKNSLSKDEAAVAEALKRDISFYSQGKNANEYLARCTPILLEDMGLAKEEIVQLQEKIIGGFSNSTEIKKWVKILRRPIIPPADMSYFNIVQGRGEIKSDQAPTVALVILNDKLKKTNMGAVEPYGLITKRLFVYSHSLFFHDDWSATPEQEHKVLFAERIQNAEEAWDRWIKSEHDITKLAGIDLDAQRPFNPYG